MDQPAQDVNNQQPATGDQTKALSDPAMDAGGQQAAPNHKMPIGGMQSQATTDDSRYGQSQVVNGQVSGQIPQSQTSVVVQPEELVGGDKERVEVRAAGMDTMETAPMVELSEQHEMEPEVEGWVEKLEQADEIKLPKPVEHEGEVLVADSGAQVAGDRIVLPMTETGMAQGMKMKVKSSARWLAEWCMRLIKLLGDQVQYKQSQPLS
jgi:hypothetical protein